MSGEGKGSERPCKNNWRYCGRNNKKKKEREKKGKKKKKSVGALGKKVFAGEIRLGDERVKLTVNKLTVSGGRGAEGRKRKIAAAHGFLTFPLD